MIEVAEIQEYRDQYFARKAKNRRLREWLSSSGRRAEDARRCSAIKKRLGRAHLNESKKNWMERMGTDAARRLQMVYNARRRAKRFGLECTITQDDISIPALCPVLGIPLNPAFVGDRHHHDDSPSLDRIDSNRGYTPDNIVVVSWRANALKRDATLEEMEKLLAFYRPLLKK